MITLFENSQFGKVRVARLNNEPIFCIADLCKILDLTPSKVSQRLSDDVLSKYPIVDSIGREQFANFVNEDGLYDVILDSRKPEAKQFRKWVTGEVLPAIRKSGGYMIEKEESPEETMSRALLIAQDTMLRQKQRLDMLQAQNNLQSTQLQIVAPKVEYYDSVLQSSSVYVADQIAKELGMTAVSMNKKLCALGILMKRNSQWVLSAKHCNSGLTKTKTHQYTKTDGSVGTNCITVWTEKGRKFLFELKENGKI